LLAFADRLVKITTGGGLQMKISDLKDANAQMIQQYQRGDNATVSSDKQAINASVKPEEKVDLSTKAKDIQQAKNALTKLPDVREEKVQEIKTQVDKGTYNVNAGKIADKMVNESIINIFA
jgi:negative regulator of flagellin synthesis FlgM